MSTPRIPLFERLPEIYRLRDAGQAPAGQLQAYLALVEDAFSAIHANIEELYHDFFIDTCDDWVIPYLADLVGTSHLKGDPRTLRMDVADTIALRRRKGTLGAIERLADDLTGWAAHGVELRENLGWHQHLNHQRPDAINGEPYALPTLTRFAVPRGGTVPVRDPAMLSLLDSPFDPFAHTADVKGAWPNAVHYNLPNLAIFLWRLAAYRIPLSVPFAKGSAAIAGPGPGEAAVGVHFDLHPLGQPLRLFNTRQFDPQLEPPVLTPIDGCPNPIPWARLTTGSEAAHPEAYVQVDPYDPALANPDSDFNLTPVGLHFFVPDNPFATDTWTFRGDNLCAWEAGLRRPLRNREIIVDSDIGRVTLGVMTAAERDALATHLLVSFTSGAVGPIGAQPVSRSPRPVTWRGGPVDFRPITAYGNPTALQNALASIQKSPAPIVVEIQDSLVHNLDPTTLPGISNDGGVPAIQLNRSLILRAADGHRPIVRLAAPLRFRPTNVYSANPAAQAADDAANANLVVQLEGVYLTRADTFPAGQPLIARAAVARLEVLDSTLDPGGFRQRDGTRAPLWPALDLREPYGFADPNEEAAFKQTPAVVLQRTIAGALRLDLGYQLTLTDSVIDAGAGPGDDGSATFALTNATAPATDYGPPTILEGVTFFGRVRAEQAKGEGAVFAHTLEVHDNQHGCLKFGYFSNACVDASDARLRFTDTWFAAPGYAQLALAADVRIRTRGPGDDAMGATGFLLEAHKWANLTIRFREFMPVGIRPLLIAVT
jgi:hypothetical protein